MEHLHVNLGTVGSLLKVSFAQSAGVMLPQQHGVSKGDTAMAITTSPPGYDESRMLSPQEKAHAASLTLSHPGYCCCTRSHSMQ
eukprot:112195-Amphidinium_carterae.2